CKEIWVMTPDLHKDRPVEGEFCFQDIVYRNVTQRGIHYKYMLPATAENDARIQAMLAPYDSEAKKHLKIIRLTSDRWNLLPYGDGDFAIYNPTMEKGCSTEAYYELPIKTRDQWVRVDDEMTVKWIGRIENVVPEVLADDKASTDD